MSSSLARNSTKAQAEMGLTVDLIEVLRAHPSGLRRWSVMRAMRNLHEAAGRSVPQKFEDDIERVFRRLSSAEGQDAVFYRPSERAGEVWALHDKQADAWLEAEGVAA
jgi:hypothetical protein